MRSSDVLLVTSENEGVTLVAFEALKNGCMVISTDVGAQREIVPSTLLVSAEPFQCVKDCVRIARNLVTSAEFRSKTIGELSEKIDYFNTLPTAKMALNRFYGDEE
jgi:glycosyltransferase involved in cell wall biosynthesis